MIVTFRANLTGIKGQAPPQTGNPTATVTLAGGLDAVTVGLLYEMADGTAVNVTIERQDPEGFQPGLPMDAEPLPEPATVPEAFFEALNEDETTP